MDKKAYFDEMITFSNKVIAYINKLISDEISQVNKDLKPIIFNYASKRLIKNTPLQKPYLFYLSYKAAGGNVDEKKLIPICAAAELLNISSYQANYALDGKDDNTDFEKIKSCFIASMLSRELVNKSIIGFINGYYLNGLTGSVFEKFSISNEKIYQGQFLDISYLTIDKFIKGEITDTNFFTEYEKRCYSLSGNFTENCAELGAILGSKDYSKNYQISLSIKEFGKNLGIGMHILNDLADNLPIFNASVFIHKSYKDQFSDLRLGKLTLPIFYALKACSNDDKHFILSLIGKTDITQESAYKFFEILTKTNSIDLTKKHIKKYFIRAKAELINVPETKEKTYLKLMLSCLRSNKYYYNIEKLNHEIIQQ